MTRRVVGRAVVLVALAAVWSVASYLLWQTKVPSSLHLPRLDEHAYFSAAQLRAAASFSRVETLLYWGTTLAEIVALAVYARFGVRYARESAAGPLGTGMLLGMLGFALVWVVQLPFGVLDLWWQRRHAISHVGYASYLFGGWVGLGGEFVFLSFALAVVMGLARSRLREWWWLAAAPVFVGLALLFAFITPYLTPTHRLQNPVLRADATQLERAEGTGHVPIDVETVHDVTSLPNSEAMGIGPSRRVVMWDTMVDGRFSDRELRVVIGHELGHLARNHIWKAVGWYALFAFPGTYLIMLAVRRRGGMGEPTAVPLSLLVLIVLGLLASPLENAISRHREAEADWMALRTTHDPAAATQLFRAFVPTTLDEPDPSTFDYLTLENHPTIMQRIAMAQAWRRYATSAAQSP
ncbi:MAG TPA: M48 family metalloprotease [Gaiellaceae bacterium]|nr:M48 family metalloprotease [Gaiellaceae bacterium]